MVFVWQDTKQYIKLFVLLTHNIFCVILILWAFCIFQYLGNSINIGIVYLLANGCDVMPHSNMSPNFKELVLGLVVIVSLFGLIGFSIIDKSSRPAFLEVAKISIGAFMGYLIPNQK